MNDALKVRPSPIVGTWYSADPNQLRQAVDAFINDAKPPALPGEVVGLIAPHAGYRYSGAVAGYAFQTVRGKHFDQVAVLSPMHQYHPQGVLTSAHSAYRTPLGDIPLAMGALEQLNKTLEARTGIALSPVANDQEHSLEIELPFLQLSVSGSFELIPIMLRDQTREVARGLGQALAEVLDPETCLLVASSDLSHFFSEAKARQLDQQVLDAMAAFSPEGLFDLKDRGEGHACGLAAIAAVLWATREWGADKVTLLNYDTSASITGDRSSVVGYGAAAITRPN